MKLENAIHKLESELTIGKIVTVIRENYKCRGKIIRRIMNCYEIEPIKGSKIKDNFTVFPEEIK
jgi:hypothetical protein